MRSAENATSDGPDFSGLGFGLSDELFDQWFQTVVFPDDAAEYIQAKHGTLEGARFVCALSYLGGSGSGDAIVHAYLLAHHLPRSQAADVTRRTEAQCLYADDATQFLLDRVRYRSERLERDRIARRTSRTIMALYDRAETLVEPTDYSKRLATEKAAIDGGIRFMSVGTKEQQHEAGRRDKRAITKAIEEAYERDHQKARPPTVQESQQYLAMLKDLYGADAFAKMIEQAALPAATVSVDAEQPARSDP